MPRRTPLGTGPEGRQRAFGKGTPWQLDPSIGDAIPVRANVVPIVSTADFPLDSKPTGEENLPRGDYLRKEVELRQYGFTSGCPGCVAALKGARL
eukprot:4666674-Karenia_brevis.AAC.1